MIAILGPVLHWLAVHTGTVNESGPYYGFWSGFGSDIGEYVIAGSIFAGMLHMVTRTNCQVGGTFPHGCKLPALHEVEVDGIKRRVCHRHSGHPVLQHTDEKGLHHETDQGSGPAGPVADIGTA